MRSQLGALLVAAALTVSTQLDAQTPAAAHDAFDNFGMPLGFSVAKMDPKADPRQDFVRFAAGRWLDVARIPGDSPYVSGVMIMNKQTEAQVGALLTDAAARSASATRGSPLQQVGDFYASGMDVERLAGLGATPLKPEWDRIAAIDGRTALAQSVAHLTLILNEPILIGASVTPDAQDTSRYAVAVSDGPLPLPARDDYLSPTPEMAKLRDAYLVLVTQAHVLAGLPAEEARARAEKVLAMETRIAKSKLSEVDRADPRKLIKRLSYADLKQLVPNFDVDAYFEASGLPAGHEVLAVDVGALAERNALLGEASLEDTKAYLQWELLRHAAPYLSPQFVAALDTFNGALYGLAEAPKREQAVAAEVARRLGQPLGRLYVEQHLSPEDKAQAEQLVASIRREFRSHLEQNAWLTAPTRQYAIEKLDNMTIVVGYPDKWIDYSTVDVRRDDYYGNMLRLNEFAARRANAKFGKPVDEDEFNDPRSTLPTVVNAAYTPERNDIEIPAAFLQPPFFDAKADAAVNYCTLGAVIGHEITHGFDSQGRLYDAEGDVRLLGDDDHSDGGEHTVNHR